MIREIKIDFLERVRVEILGEPDGNKYLVEFINQDTRILEYSREMYINNWAVYIKSYFVNWLIRVTGPNYKYEYKYDCTDKKVVVYFSGTGLGDAIAWLPACVEFVKKHNCNLYVMTNWAKLFSKVYPEINFVNFADTTNEYARYRINLYHNDKNRNHQPNDWRTIPLQQISSDILGIEYKESAPKIDVFNIKTSMVKRPKKYVCISEHTALGYCKLWHYPGGWQEVVDYLISKDYEVVVISTEPTKLVNVIDMTNNSIEVTMGLLMNCEFYIGVASGLAWLSWTLGKRVIMFSGFSLPWCEFQTNNYRISGVGNCVGCLHDVFIDTSRWNSNCPRNQDNTCTKQITPKMVTNMIDRLVPSINIPISSFQGDYVFETTKANKRRQKIELFHRIFKGKGIDIGAGQDNVNKDNIFKDVEYCESFDVGHGDAQYINSYKPENFYDFVHSSHCLEHMVDPFEAIKNWFSLVKPGGYLVVTVPDEDLYEQGYWPSKFSTCHNWTMTINKEKSWSPKSVNVLGLIQSLEKYEIIKIELVDVNYNYSLKNFDQCLNEAECCVEFIIRKKE